MIAFCRQYTVSILNKIGINQVFIQQAAANQYKGLIFALVECDEEKLQKQYIRVAQASDRVNKIITTRYRIYLSNLPILVTMIGKDLEQADTFRQTFLQQLGNTVLDPDQNSIAIEAQTCKTVIEKSLSNPRQGFEISIMYTGGIYLDVPTNMLTGDMVVPNIKIVKEG